MWPSRFSWLVIFSPPCLAFFAVAAVERTRVTGGGSEQNGGGSGTWVKVEDDESE